MQLPEGELSYLLQEWDQLLGIEQAFGLVRDTLETMLSFRQSVATLFRDPDRPREKPPEARQKRYWTALTRAEGGRTVRAQDEVFQHLRDDVALRRRRGQTVVHLSDGQHSLETDRRKYLPLDLHTMDVLDLMHVLPRLWEAAHLFHREGSEAASQFVRERLHRVLEGEAGRVVGGLRQMGTKHGLRGHHRHGSHRGGVPSRD